MCVCVCERAGQVLNTTITLYGGSVYGTDTGLDADLATMPIGPAQLGPRPARRSRVAAIRPPLLSRKSQSPLDEIAISPPPQGDYSPPLQPAAHAAAPAHRDDLARQTLVRCRKRPHSLSGPCIRSRRAP